MWIKICGNTRLEDCQIAAEQGADGVGFVFAPGRRTVTAGQVAAMTPYLPNALDKIGVFTSVDAGGIARIAKAAGLTGVQLHSAFHPGLAASLREEMAADGRFRLIQVVHWWTDIAAGDQRSAFADTCAAVAGSGLVDALLVDSRTRLASGGTGVTFDWVAAQPILAGLRMPVIVAGGLRPENVAEAVQALQPWGVDTASGVEASPGVKDAAKMQSFLANARAADTGKDERAWKDSAFG